MKKMLLIIAAAAMICGCSREGFEESLNREKADAPADPGEAIVEQPDYSAEDFVFTLATDEYEKEKGIYYYALPEAPSDDAAEAAGIISAELEGIISSLEEEIAAGRDYDSFSVYDAITQNNGKIFSVFYEIEITLSDETEEEYAIGLVYDSVTGKRLQLEDLKDPETVVTLILDEQISTIPGRDEELKAQKRQYLSEQGESDLLERLTTDGGLEELLDASYYVDGDDLAVLISADQALGGYVEVTVDM